MTTARPPAPTPAVGPATCTAAANLATAAVQLLITDELLHPATATQGEITTDRPSAEARAEAARMLRTAAELVAPGPPAPRPPAMRGERVLTPEQAAELGRTDGPSTSEPAADPAHDPTDTSNSGQDGGGDEPGPAPAPGRRISPRDVARTIQRGRRG